MRKFFFTICLGILFSQTDLNSLYYSYDEIRNQLYAWNEEFGNSNHSFYNSIVYQLDSIGVSSNENLPIYAVKLSWDADIDEDEAKVLILGQCHAEEILGVEMSMTLIDWLLHPEEHTLALTKDIFENELMYGILFCTYFVLGYSCLSFYRGISVKSQYLLIYLTYIFIIIFLTRPIYKLLFSGLPPELIGQEPWLYISVFCFLIVSLGIIPFFIVFLFYKKYNKKNKGIH